MTSHQAELASASSTSALLEENAALRHENEQLMRANDALAAANDELKAFSYSIAHDLRAPLRSIDAFSRTLAEDAGAMLDDDAHMFLLRVREFTQDMQLLIDDLLHLSALSDAELCRERVDLTSLAQASIDRLREANPDRTVEVVIERNLKVNGDPRLLALALDNLIGNAWKFTAHRPDARIAVGCQAEAEPVYYVCDNGTGFDPASAEKLFRVFQRMQSDSASEGPGVGLATVQRAIRRHGGRIWADGAVDQGATFFLTLP